MNRHIKEFHCKHAYDKPKDYVCAEPGCGKMFKYPCKLRKHEDSHVKLDSVEALCSEPGCMKYFTNKQCLKEHVRSCHQYIVCGECGIKQLKKNIKHHIQIHKTRVSSYMFKCGLKGCRLKFSNQAHQSCSLGTQTTYLQHSCLLHLLTHSCGVTMKILVAIPTCL